MTDQKDIDKAVEILQEGGLVAIPTETVYGLAADADNPEAVAKIYAAKKRPSTHPLIVHVANQEAINSWAVDIPEDAWKLTEAFWPGPLTLILKRSERAKDFITGGQNTVALRCPSHPLTRQVLQKFDEGVGNGVAAPSANPFGKISPTLAQHVRDDLGLVSDGGSVDFILDGGACDIGIESTILDLTDEEPRILREGAVTAAMIADRLNKPVLHGTITTSPRVPGTLKSHYAPDHPLILSSTEDLPGKAQFLARQFKTFGVIAPTAVATRFAPISEKSFGYSSTKDLTKHLYDWLHQLDKLKIDAILVVPPKEISEAAGVLDRLQRASAKRNL
ncbi:MAG: threonylcarbamoyl-AMP synthase [Burkholderiales bacterium]|nr:threonylcarbamoyl-AMP synthase [Burkholderiales bacterium]